MFQTMGKFTAQTDSLKDVILSAPPAQAVTDNANARLNRVDVMTRAKGNDLYVFAVRLTDVDSTGRPLPAEPASLNVTFTVPGLSGNPVAVYGESRNITMTGNQFTDAFAQNAYHIYKIANGVGIRERTAMAGKALPYFAVPNPLTRAGRGQLAALLEQDKGSGIYTLAGQTVPVESIGRTGVYLVRYNGQTKKVMILE
jgi:hypothetical protein